jgi:starch synthase
VEAPLRVLFVTPEAHPLATTGGLGDVGGALPSALRALGMDVRILLPAYPGVVERSDAGPLGEPFQVLPDAVPIQLCSGTLPGSGTPVYLLDCPELYHRQNGPYVDADGRDWPDNWLRFAVLSRVAALFDRDRVPAGWNPDIVHCNDWQTALAPAYLANTEGTRARTVLGVHNIAFQGNFPARLMSAIGLPQDLFSVDGVEFYGQLSYLKAGLRYADHIIAVSPTYAREIQTPEFGLGMQGLLVARRGALSGILNGVDTDLWNPETDQHLPAHYGVRRMEGKAANKHALQERMGLSPKADVPLLGMVGRLTHQKGVDLVLEIAEALVKQSLQLAILGTGEKTYQGGVARLATEHPGQVGAVIDYDEALAHLVEAGSDIFLMPSRYEPCGLNQMYSMLYGTPPVVRRTGGLADSVVDAMPSSLANGTATGFVFDAPEGPELLACVLRALRLFRDRKAWSRLQRNGMRRDFSWKTSAQHYRDLYRLLAGRETAHVKAEDLVLTTKDTKGEKN